MNERTVKPAWSVRSSQLPKHETPVIVYIENE
jgi:hypothetical protein